MVSSLTLAFVPRYGRRQGVERNGSFWLLRRTNGYKKVGVPVWSLDGRVCIGEMLKNAVRLAFPKGAQMKDPKKLFNARLDSCSVRAIDFREGKKVPEAALRALIVEAVDLNV